MNDNLALKIKKTVIPSQRESQNQHTYIKQFNEHNQRGSLSEGTKNIYDTSIAQHGVLKYMCFF